MTCINIGLLVLWLLHKVPLQGLQALRCFVLDGISKSFIEFIIEHFKILFIQMNARFANLPLIFQSGILSHISLL